MMELQIPGPIKDIPEVKLHPATIKHLEKGHPWITADSFSSKFPNDPFIKFTNKNQIFLFINDKKHQKIKARLWKITKKAEDKINFLNDLKIRLEKSLQKRTIQLNRDNQYLVFAEADGLPGLFIQQLNQKILIQSQTHIWENYLEILITDINQFFGVNFEYWWQERDESKKFPLKINQHYQPIQEQCQFTLKEFNLSYNLFLGQNYDIGIYTDMASIRDRLQQYLTGDSFLNLYSYTGAFSILANSKGFKNICSVDISPHYLEIFKKNIISNHFNLDTHRIFESNAFSALDKLAKEKSSFDFIICDPPSASSDGKKITKAFDIYPEIIIKIFKLLNDKGSVLLCLNTHHIGIKKFEDMILKNVPPKTEIIERFKLGQDCPTLPYFPEGNYLKAILLKKNL